MATQKKGAAHRTRTAQQAELLDLPDRLTRTKQVLVAAPLVGALTFDEAALIAVRLHRSYPLAWRAA